MKKTSKYAKTITSNYFKKKKREKSCESLEVDLIWCAIIGT